MGTKQLIILSILSLLFISCTREVLKGTGTGTGEKVGVSLKIRLDTAVGSRADSEWEYDKFFPEITDEERKVTNILLVVFKDILLEEYDFYDQGEFQQDATDFSILLENDEGDDLLDLEPGPHYFYALLNLPSDLKATALSLLRDQEGKLTKEEFEKQILEKSLDYLTDETNGFVMTNTAPPTLRGIYSEEQLEKDDNLNNDVVITVGRAVGKISFAYAASELNTGELHGSLSNVRYKILNNPARMYLMPVIEDDLLITPHYSTTSYPAGYFSPTAWDADILEETTSVWLPATTINTVNNQEVMAYGYCMENHNKNSLRSNSTMLLIEATFEPAVWLNKDGTTGNPSDDGTFYRIGQFNTNDVLYGYIQGYYNEDPVEVVDGLNSPNPPTTGAYKSVKYEKGLTYYGFWPANNERFQVKRNTYYKIAITHIHGAGDPGPQGPVDPDVDPEDQSTNGRLAVYAVSWDEEYMIVTIGEDQDDPALNPGVGDWEKEENDKGLESGDGKNEFN